MSLMSNGTSRRTTLCSQRQAYEATGDRASAMRQMMEVELDSRKKLKNRSTSSSARRKPPRPAQRKRATPTRSPLGGSEWEGHGRQRGMVSSLSWLRITENLAVAKDGNAPTVHTPTKPPVGNITDFSTPSLLRIGEVEDRQVTGVACGLPI